MVTWNMLGSSRNVGLSIIAWVCRVTMCTNQQLVLPYQHSPDASDVTVLMVVGAGRGPLVRLSTSNA